MKMATLLLMPILSIAAFAQSGETAVFVGEFQNLQISMNQIYSEVSKRDPDVHDQARINLLARLLALKKTAHQLQEDVGSADFEAQKKGQRVDKRLRLVDQGCMSIDSVLEALTNFLDTGDYFFVGIASDLRQTVDSIRKVL